MSRSTYFNGEINEYSYHLEDAGRRRPFSARSLCGVLGTVAAFAQDAAPAAAAAAAAAPALDNGDTAWMLTSTALVLMMTIPGPGAVLRRHGAQEEHAGDHHAELRRSPAW